MNMLEGGQTNEAPKANWYREREGERDKGTNLGKMRQMRRVCKEERGVIRAAARICREPKPG